jgi:hypothetical protein
VGDVSRRPGHTAAARRRPPVGFSVASIEDTMKWAGSIPIPNIPWPKMSDIDD